MQKRSIISVFNSQAGVEFVTGCIQTMYLGRMDATIKNWKLKLVLAASFILLFSLACILSPVGNFQPHGKVVYQSDQDGNSDLYSINVRDGSVTRLTNNSFNDISPAFIPITKEIGFVSDRDNEWNIYRMGMKGQNTQAITELESIGIDYPSWSPDGKTIAASVTENCAAEAKACNYDIYSMDSDGNQFLNLTHTRQSEWVPVWSPDGQKIAFSSDRDGDDEIFVMNWDGTGVVQITNNSAHDGRPCWSPDGKQILFETDRDGVDWDIYRMAADGSDPQPVTNNRTNDFFGSWSPDGKWIVYLSNSDGDSEIYILSIEGENQRRLTTNSSNEAAPIWTP